jgi:hypothetical protein
MSKKKPPKEKHKPRAKEIYSICKSCVFDYKRKRPIKYDEHPYQQSEKKLKLVEMMGGKCEICGYDKSIVALSFHHKDRRHKTFTISSYLSMPMDELIIEAKKCRLICLNCHAELHHKAHVEKSSPKESEMDVDKV